MSDKKHIAEWVRKCRGVLIEMETKNITQRALSWTQIVNTETMKINSMLGVHHQLSQSNLLYHYDVREPLKYLTFLSEWNGIKTRGSSSHPSCYADFESKAKNWLNGRRAPNYGNTLFPDMIKSSDKYAKKLSSLLFADLPLHKLSSTAPASDSLQNQYEKTLMFAYLNKLCTERIAVHQSWKKTNLLCENSVKNMHSNTAKLLQQYAIHDYTDIENDLNSFPGSLQRAAAFFSEQHNRYMALLMNNYDAYKNNQRSPPHVHSTNTFVDGVVHPQHVENNSNHNVSRNVHSQSSSHSSSSVVNDGDRVPPINYVAIKRSDIAVIMDRLAALERKHNDQANQISSLTAKCQLLQTHIDHEQANDVHDPRSSMIPAMSSSGGAVSHFDKLTSSNDEFTNDQALRFGVAQNASSMHGSRSRGVQLQTGLIGLQSSPSMTTHSGPSAGHNDSNSVNTRSTHYSANQLALPPMGVHTSSSSSAPSSASSTHPHPVPVPIPFSLSAHRENNENSDNNINRSQSAYLLHSQHQFDLSYHAPPSALTALYNTNTATTSSTPRSASINQYGGASSHPLTAPPPHSPHRSTIGGYHSYDYGLPLQAPFAMFSNPNNNTNENKNEDNTTLNDRDADDELADSTMHYMTSSMPNTASNNLGLYNSSFLSSDALMFDHHNSTPNANGNLFTFSQMEYN
eukprot:CAMPEP_0197023580 /NCGR_PEP_ID=MMETSP1384-20130603/4250_1 /TAXON_ID=29189 /ORGANISM="Ammonia sp." /LENGTH=684 /DNA_ID=CAMNT_0042451813 /DNA_START=180 /DNA_END=2234 /DNA_ORIENTATION=+